MKLNVWKDNYKKSVDGVKMPLQLKDKIIKDTPKRLAERRRRLNWLSRTAGGAAAAVICCLMCFMIAGYQSEQSRLPYPRMMAGDAGVSNEETVEYGQADGRQTAAPYIRRPSGTANSERKQGKYALPELMAVMPYPEGITMGENNGKKNISREDLQLLRDLKIPSYIPEGYVMSDINRKDKGPAQITYASPTDTLVYNVRMGVATPLDKPDDKYMNYSVTVSDGNTILLQSSEGLCYNVIWVGDDGNTYSMTSENGLAQDTVNVIVDSVGCVDAESGVSYEINQ